MIKTKPIPISILTGDQFVLGRRVSRLLAEPFDMEALKKRVLRKSRDRSKGEAAYYIDTRDLDARLDQVVGASNWDCHIVPFNLGDRVGVTATITIGGVPRTAESEEAKMDEAWDPVFEDVITVNGNETITWRREVVDKDGKQLKRPQGRLESKDLVLLKAGPNAIKRAAVHFGVGAYLYGFSDVNTWEEVDTYGGFKNPKVDITKLPDFARPTAGPQLLLDELAFLFDLDIPNDLKTLQGDNLEQVKGLLNKYWGVTTLSKGLERADFMELTACMARISDYCELHGRTFEEFLEEFKIKVPQHED